MSFDWFLDPLTGDLPEVFRGTRDGELIIQRIRVRLQTFLTEVLEDKRAGLPFERWASFKVPELDEVVAFFRREVDGVPGVLRTEEVSAEAVGDAIKIEMTVIAPEDDALRIRLDLFGVGDGATGTVDGLVGSDPAPVVASPIIVVTLLDSFIGL